MPKKLVNFRLPEDVIEAIRTTAKERGVSQSVLVEEMLRANWEGDVKAPRGNPHGGFTAMTSRETTFDQRVGQLVNQGNTTPVARLIARQEGLKEN